MLSPFINKRGIISPPNQKALAEAAGNKAMYGKEDLTVSDGARYRTEN